MLFLVAQSIQACVIFAAVSAEISFLISVFLAASSEMTNLLMFCADTTPATIAEHCHNSHFHDLLLLFHRATNLCTRSPANTSPV